MSPARTMLPPIMRIRGDLGSRRVAALATAESGELRSLFDATVQRGESNSVLVLGPRGVGKTDMVNAVCEDVLATAAGNELTLVRLHGLTETDDRLALREIARQMKLDNVVRDKVFGSFSEHLEFLLASLRTGDRATSRPIAFVLDEFDLFTEHRNQTLLYNLFDTAQARSAPMLVVGVSSKIDVVESMEKRVKSRFSHRAVHLRKPADFEAYCALAGDLLRCEGGDAAAKAWNETAKVALRRPACKSALREMFDRNSVVANLKQTLAVGLCRAAAVPGGGDDVDPDGLAAAIAEAASVMEPDYDELTLSGLSVLETALMVAAKVVHASRDEQQFNFEQVFSEYRRFCGHKCSQQSLLTFDRAVITKCWETLVAAELLRSLDRGSKIQNEYKMYALGVLPSAVVRAAENCAGIPVAVKEWARSGIIET